MPLSQITFGSVCSGIEAASVAWHPLGWRAEWLSEIEPFPCAVLAHHYPEVPNLGDMTTIARRVLTGEVEGDTEQAIERLTSVFAPSVGHTVGQQN